MSLNDKYLEGVVDTVCKGIIDGHSLKEILATSENMPDISTFQKAVRSRGDLFKRIEAAKGEQREKMKDPAYCAHCLKQQKVAHGTKKHIHTGTG